MAGLYRVLDPSSWARFAGNAFGENSGAGAVFHRSFGSLLEHAILSSGPYSISIVVSFAVAASVMSLVALAGLRYTLDRRSIFFGIAVLIFVLLPVALFPAENNYMAWARTGLLVLFATHDVPSAVEARRRSVVTVLLATVVLANVPFVFLNAVIQLQSRERYDVASVEAARFSHAVASQSAGALMLVPASVYFLYKRDFGAIADAARVDPVVSAGGVGGIVSCGTGQRLTDKSDGSTGYRIHPIGLETFRPSVLGVPLTRGGWDWVCDQLLAH